MNKILAIAFLLVSALAIGFATSGATHPSAGTFAGPRVIAKVNLTNQTSAIPTTTLFTAPETGLYRVSGYLTMTTPVIGGSYSWIVPLTWNDDAGTETAFFAAIGTASVPPQDFAGNANGTPDSTFVIRVLAGTPVTFYSYTGIAGGTYALFMVAERLD
jgi:hypothetical protein